MSEKQSSNAFVWGFLAGAAATAVYTLLKTPRSGHETIEQIKGQGSRLKTRAEEKVGGLRRHAEETTDGWQYAAPCRAAALGRPIYRTWRSRPSPAWRMWPKRSKSRPPRPSRRCRQRQATWRRRPGDVGVVGVTAACSPANCVACD